MWYGCDGTKRSPEDGLDDILAQALGCVALALVCGNWVRV